LVQSWRITGIVERLRVGCVHQAQKGVVANLGEKLRTVFSKKATDGARSVADEQLMIASPARRRGCVRGAASAIPVANRFRSGR
jgi:hypothetical protein